MVSDSWVESISNKENHNDKANTRRVSFSGIPNECTNGEKDSFYIRRNPLFKPQRQNALVDLEQTSLMVNRESPSGKDSEQINTTNGNKSVGTPSSSILLDETAKDSSKHSNSSLG